MYRKAAGTMCITLTMLCNRWHLSCTSARRLTPSITSLSLLFTVTTENKKRLRVDPWCNPAPTLNRSVPPHTSPLSRFRHTVLHSCQLCSTPVCHYLITLFVFIVYACLCSLSVRLCYFVFLRSFSRVILAKKCLPKFSAHINLVLITPFFWNIWDLCF